MAIVSILAFIADWSTPTVLFCVLNLMIATIFIASNYKAPNHHHDTPSQLARSPSLLERVKSVNLSSFSFYTTPDQSKTTESNSTESHSVSQLGRRPSLLQRVKSIDFSFSSFHNSVPNESEQLGNSPTERTRTFSLIDRVKSFKLTTPFNSDQHSDNTESSKDEHLDIEPHQDSVEDNNSNNVTSVKSPHNESLNLSEKSTVTPVKRLPSRLSKSSSEVASSEDDEVDDERKPQATRKAAVRVHDESVDAKADDFIKRFKQQLKLQRLDSLQRLREMLNRGT
ncbi:uncharacterized protein LOC143632549 [Bidens hawaiensis]|uniref:uncharacterized protein LOC143632549 n=1 Tax=Bidens hawaiensis TaxID=980011 RepID=UPI00404ADBA1